MTEDEIYAKLGGPNPFSRDESWRGRLSTMDDTDTTDFTIEDVAEVIAAGDSGDTWDGEVAAIMLLKDGRYVTYETFWGPTGDGFSEDAYGGDADIVFSSSLDHAIRYGLTRTGRKLTGTLLPDEQVREDAKGG